MIRRFGGAFIACILLGATASGQKVGATSRPPAKRVESSDLGRPLTRKKHLVVPSHTVGLMYPPFRCDSEGNVYARLGRGSLIPIEKFDTEARLVSVFRADNLADLHPDLSDYFFLGVDGELYQLALAGEDQYVVTFRHDGSPKTKTKLEAPFWFTASQIAVFDSGEILVAGKKEDKPGSLSKVPFTALFSSRGQLLKEITLSGDETLLNAIREGDSRGVKPDNPGIISEVELGSAEAGTDGNIYLMRRTTPAQIYAISPGAEVVRRINVDPGDSAFKPFTFHISGNRAAILFTASTKAQLIKVVDLEGHQVATYFDPAPEKGGRNTWGVAFTCYSAENNEFTFLGVDNRKLAIDVFSP